ncbi:THAP domain-containing protein 8 isoform X1 [Neofelis nebulosa]|uniref:THAP domain-containing protein 8 isoform X1 n=1 Tax=Neofelis nebulosa TaxID=61452 RepID=UPI00272DAD63|nr:THAP domain-containing protein 8 isoform X1 [Neofelis nebulosa]
MAPGCGPGCGTWAMRTGCPAATSTCAVSTSHLPASSGAGVCATCGLMQCPPFSPQCRLLRSSRVPEAPRSQSCLPPHRASRPPTPGPALSSPGPVHLVVLGPAPRGSEASATVFLAPLILPPAPARPRPGVRAQHPLAGLGTILGALQRRVRRP